ncbi:cytochrome c oxidase subunit I [Ramlibacter rhizophilus]|uniref:cytochrome-c oxidase n=1 Tax=Ramlibacter rhizophilus TaxID=1781167 RepID=A0A4Z0C1Y9_9BURK|nr:cytochrome c oxidase subunit I [Ramlibacter rhizophilus]TFZ04255.1 cytochrome c oxidase subunit I [Ramlibacter rhizophilus]
MSEPVLEAPPRDADRLHEEFEAVWGNPRGWRALAVVNHTIVMRRFMVTGGVFFVIAGLLAMLMRAQIARPEQAFMTPEAYNQAFTMHGTMMMFLFAVPVLQGLSGYLLPKMLGARDLVFPRLSAFGFWCYLFGGTLLTFSLVLGLAPDAGWFMYTPLASRPFSPGVQSDFWLIGVTFVEIASVSAAVDLIVSILRTRARGMDLQHLPIFAWAVLVSSFMVVLGFPPLILGSILLELERAAGWAFYDPTRGGDPLLWQHLFWLFGHPEVYIIFLPAAGIVSTLVPVFARRPLVGYTWVVVSLIATGFLSFGLWVHHMFAVGIPALAQAFFAAASMLVAIPSGIQVFAWIATLWSGRPVWSLPMLWIAGFVAIFVLGGLTGVMVAFVPFDWQVHDTHFVVAHLHYVLIGGMLFPLVAGLYYWMPLFSGRMPSPALGQVGFWLTFIGFNGTFLVMHWTGLLGMPRRVYTYPGGLGWDLPNLVSSVFGFVMAFGLAAVLLDWLLHWRHGRRAPVNPWNAPTLEWAAGMPPRSYNFASLPTIPTRHPLWESPELPRSIAEGRHGLPQAGHGRRETLGCNPVTGEPREVMVLPGNSWWPLLAALLLTALCIGLLTKVYGFALVMLAAVVLVLLRWSWENGTHVAGAAEHAKDLPEGLRLHTHTFDGPGLWGTGTALLANAALYASLLFAWFYLWTAAPNWRPPASSPIGVWPLGLASAGLLAGWVAVRSVVVRLRARQAGGLRTRLLVAAAAGAAGCAALALLLVAAPLQPAVTAHDAMIAFTLWYLLVHGALCSVAAALQAWRIHAQHVGIDAPYEPQVVLMLWQFTGVAAVLGWAALSLLPLLLR